MTRCRAIRAIGLVLAALIVVSCSGGTRPTEEDMMTSQERRKARVGKLFGEDTLAFGPGARREEAPAGGGGIAVNGFLWRASLDTMSFMPLNSADPFGGIIITDWYSPPETVGERFRVQIYILDRQLRADGVRVTVFRQVQDESGQWNNAVVSPETASELENAILTRARQLRINSGGI